MKSLVWTGVFVFWLVELLITAILVIPVPRKIRNAIARRVNRLNLGHRIAKVSFYIVIALVIALADTIRTAQLLEQRAMNHAPPEMQVTMKEEMIWTEHDKKRIYKAQRNMYLTGFALTLLFVIGRLTQLMQESVELEEEVERLTKASPSPTAPVEGEGVEMKPLTQKKKD